MLAEGKFIAVLADNDERDAALAAIQAAIGNVGGSGRRLLEKPGSASSPRRAWARQRLLMLRAPLLASTKTPHDCDKTLEADGRGYVHWGYPSHCGCARARARVSSPRPSHLPIRILSPGPRPLSLPPPPPGFCFNLFTPSFIFRLIFYSLKDNSDTQHDFARARQDTTTGSLRAEWD